VDLIVSAPAMPTVSAETVDNFVWLRWNDCTTTLPVVRYELYRDAVFIGDNGDGRFATRPEQAAGTYSYSVIAVDSAGNESAAGAVTAIVSAPPDYILRDEFDADFNSGTITNGILWNGTLLLPVYAETDAEHTTRLG